jgi:thiol:disulfide interchange protein DsbD
MKSVLQTGSMAIAAACLAGGCGRTKLVPGAKLVAETEAARPGTPVEVGVRLILDEGWHTYWRNPGEAGAAAEITWSLPEGWQAGSVKWPFPRRFVDRGVTSFGYENEVLLAAALTPPADAEPGSVATIGANVSWLTCKGICLPNQTNLSLSLPIAAGETAASAASTGFARTRSKWPVRNDRWRFTATQGQGTFILRVVPPNGTASGAVEQAEFVPLKPGYIGSVVQGWNREGDAYSLVLDSEGAEKVAGTLRGVLILPDGMSEKALVVEAPFEETDVETGT